MVTWLTRFQNAGKYNTPVIINKGFSISLLYFPVCLDEILKKFLECFERYKYDESGVDLFDSFSSMLEFKKHFTAILSDFPELSTTNISTDLNKLLALLADRDENVIEPAFHLMSDLHSLLHERIYHLTGQISCSIKRDSKDSSEQGENDMSLEDIKKTFEDNKANIKLPSAERILITAGERGVSKVKLLSHLTI